MPGRAEPASYIEGKDAEIEGNERERDDGGGTNAGMRDIKLWPGVGGRTVFIIGQADKTRWGIWSRVPSRGRRVVVKKRNRLGGCSGRRGQEALEERFRGGKR